MTLWTPKSDGFIDDRSDGCHLFVWITTPTPNPQGEPLVVDQQGSAPASDIKSRPDYGVLRPVLRGDRNLILAEGTGIQAVLRMFGEAPDDFGGRSTLLYAQTGSPATHELDCLRAFGLTDIDVVPALPVALFDDVAVRVGGDGT